VFIAFLSDGITQLVDGLNQTLLNASRHGHSGMQDRFHFTQMIGKAP
jgi:hypothetical protein